MKPILLLLALFGSIHLMAQTRSIGFVVEFNADVELNEQMRLMSTIKNVQAVNEAHCLKGFGVTLLLAENGLDEPTFDAVQREIEVLEEVKFVSLLKKTESGAIGADLPLLYLKPTNNELDTKTLEEFGVYNVKKHETVNNVWKAELSKETISPRKLQAILMQTGQFEFVAVNTLHTVLATADDTYADYQWALENNGTPIQYSGTVGADMGVTDAWTFTTGDPSIKIAVLDSGVDTNHVDLMDNLLPGFDATGEGSKGYPNTTYPNDGHGTSAAGIIGAKGDNDEGIAGVAYDCSIIPVKIFFYINLGAGPQPFTTSEAGTDGIIWAVNSAGADILSNSWGLLESDILALGIDTSFSNMVIRENYQNGRGGKGVPMLFSSGNEYDPYSVWPASVKETISVGATSMCDELKSPTDCSPESWGSNYGENLDVTAPGTKILTTDMSGALGYNGFEPSMNYTFFNGTSAACPNAAGVVGLILSMNPELSAFDARGILATNATKTGGYDYDEPDDFGLRSVEMGYGRVNAFDAVFYTNFFSSTTASKFIQATVFYTNDETWLSIAAGTTLTTITLIDVTGRVINRISGNFVSTLNLSDYFYASGVYLLELTGSTGNKSVHRIAIH